jgi:dTDP-4-amino-4,6-dideoxygalactose transaminase
VAEAIRSRAAEGPRVAQPGVTFSDADKQAMLERVAGVLESGVLTAGTEVNELEDAMARSAGRPVIAYSSGTTALGAALRYAVSPKARVMLPLNGHIADRLAVIEAGAMPLWCAVNEWGAMNLDVAADALSEARIDAVVYVSVGGYVDRQLEEFAQLCASMSVQLVCDMSHAIGSTAAGIDALAFGDVAVASLFATKVVTSGEGGVVSTIPQNAGWFRAFRDLGRAPYAGQDGKSRELFTIEHASNLRMPEVSAAIGNVSWASLPDRLAQRRALADVYDAELDPYFKLAPRAGSSLYKYLVRVDDARAVERALLDRGVKPGARVFDTPLAMQFGWTSPDMHSLLSTPWCDEHVALPMHESLTVDDVRFVSASLIDVGISRGMIR